jgi:xylose isomerase
LLLTMSEGTQCSAVERVSGKVTFKDLEAYMLKQGDAAPNTSDRQECLENLSNEFV